MGDKALYSDLDRREDIKAELNKLLKIFQLLRRFKKFKLSRMSKYASTLNFFCFLHLEFLNSLLNNDFYNTLLRLI